MQATFAVLGVVFSLISPTLAAPLVATPAPPRVLPPECRDLAPSIGAPPGELVQACSEPTSDGAPLLETGSCPAPFFGHAPGLAALVRGQLIAPEVLTTIGSMTTANYLGACDFVNPDFSQLLCIDSGNPGNYFSVSTADASQTEIGNTGALPNGEVITGMTWDDTTSTMYASGTNCGVGSTLYTINLASGTATAVGPQNLDGTCAIDIGADFAGNLFTLDIVTDSLYSINKISGTQTAVGATGVDLNFGQAMDFDPSDGTCYIFAFNAGTFQAELYTCNSGTGAFTFVGGIGSEVPGDSTQVDAVGITAGALNCFPCCIDTFSSCCQANNSPGCDDPVVEQCVCDIDPFCCNTAWDAVCAAEAVEIGCTDCAPTGTACVVIDGSACMAAGGTQVGNECEPDPCVFEPPDGQCCEGDGTPGNNTCTVTKEADCPGEWEEGGTCEDGDATCDTPPATIPTLGGWGLVFMAVLLLTLGACLFGRRRVTSAQG